MNRTLQYRILGILAQWEVPRHTFDVSFLNWGEIVVKAGGQTVKILSTGEIHFRDRHICDVPEKHIAHLVAGMILTLHTEDEPVYKLGVYPTDKQSPEYYE